MRPDPLPELLEPFLSDPRRAGVITDFDGTLARIVDDPTAAVAVPGALEVLGRLVGVYGRVAVVSGRPLSFLQERTAGVAGLALRGVYGLERSTAGEVTEHPDAEPWRPVVTDVAHRLEHEAPAGVHIERKGLSVTVHYRTAPEHGPWVDAWTADVIDESGLVRQPGRMSWELLPPVPVDKGTTVLDLAHGLDAVCFLGDDKGDLPAFSALDHLATHEGRSVLKVVVSSAEAPPDLLREADVCVDGPEGAVELLRRLLPEGTTVAGSGG